MVFDSPTYNIKIYTASNTLKATVPDNKVMSKVAFTQNIGAGQGELTLEINAPFNSSDYSEGDLIKVIVFNQKHPNGRQIYFGQITKLTRTQDTNSENIVFTCLGINYIANNIFIIQQGYNADPGDILKSLIDMINAKYPGALLSYAGGNIQNYGSNLGIGFNLVTVAQAIQTVVNSTNFYYFVDAEGEVYFQPKPSTPTHLLTHQKDTEKINLIRNNEAVRNAVVVRYITNISINGVPFYGYVTADNVPSQIANGFREVYVDGSDWIPVGDAVAAQAYADEVVQSFLNVKNETTIIVNSNYDIVSILPGQTIKVLNFDYSIANFQILKTSYDGSTTTLTMERLFTFAEAVNK